MKTDAIDNYVYDFVYLMLHILLVYNCNVLCFVCQKWLVESIEHTFIFRLLRAIVVNKLFSKSLSAITLKIMILRLPLIIFRHRLIVFRWLQILFCYTNCFISCKSQHLFSVWIKSQRAEMIALDGCQKKIACL